jgi:hypothetical protein
MTETVSDWLRHVTIGRRGYQVVVQREIDIPAAGRPRSRCRRCSRWPGTRTLPPRRAGNLFFRKEIRNHTSGVDQPTVSTAQRHTGTRLRWLEDIRRDSGGVS